MRRPTGESGVGAGFRWASAASALSRSPFSVLTRRSTGARSASALPSSAAVGAEARLEVPAPATRENRRARARARRRGRAREPLALGRRSAAAGAWPSPVNSAAIASTSRPRVCLQRADHPPRGVASPISQASKPCGATRRRRGRDRRAVARAGEAVREAPVLHRVGGRTAAAFDVGENFDGGGDAGGGSHAPSCRKPRTKAKTGSLRSPVPLVPRWIPSSVCQSGGAWSTNSSSPLV